MGRISNRLVHAFFKHSILRKKSLAALFVLLYVVAISLFLQTETIPQLTAQSPITLYSNQTSDNLKKVTLEAIASAKKSIVIMIFSLTDTDVIALLQQKVADGV
ncbi:MAG TPA: hypothetical protein VN457_00865, partial [Chlamydiales bacterium]|nr:hypothetical protein [Chlamydiales bacterium]